MKRAEDAGDVSVVRERIVWGILSTGSISMAFKVRGKKKITYSTIPHTRTESCAEIV